MTLITQNLGNIIVGSLVVLILAIALRNIIKNFGHCNCHCADCPKEIAKDCHCCIKSKVDTKKVEE
ncbi:MAG: hypothetical protein Q4C78_01455 [Synergistaceae bacterium]|nr:hypothetical protein [Synergistaceae bacterium]